MKYLECDTYTVDLWHWIDMAPLINMSVYSWQECYNIVCLTIDWQICYCLCSINCAPTGMPSPHVYVSFVTTSIIPGFDTTYLLIKFSRCILFFCLIFYSN